MIVKLEVNEREIQPKTSWMNGEERTLNVFKIDGFYYYDFAHNSGLVHWVLLESKVTNVDGKPVRSKIPVTEGEVRLPKHIVDAWGEDDQPIFDFVMDAINVVPA